MNMKDFVMRLVLLGALSAVAVGMSLRAQSFEHDGLRYNVTGGNEVEVSGYSGESINLIIPAEVLYNGFTYKVVKIGDEAFKSENFVSVKLPDGLEIIGKYAFGYNFDLKSIYMPNSVKYIGDGAFIQSGLASIDLPLGLEVINGNTFRHSSIRTVNIPESVKSIGIWAFSDCDNLVSINLPDSLESIESAAFAYCDSLMYVNFPESLKKIGDNSFFQCSRLSSVEFPSNIESIGRYAFADCGFKELILPSDLVFIGDNAFNNCNDLSSVVFLSNALDIHGSAFMHCKNIKEVFIFGNKYPAVSNDVLFKDSLGCSIYSFLDDQFPEELADSATLVKLNFGTIEENVYYTGLIPELGVKGNTSSYEMIFDEKSLTPWLNSSAGIYSFPGFRFWFYKKGENKNKIPITIYKQGSYIIHKAPLVVSADSLVMTYGDVLPKFDLSYSGFVNGEDSTVIIDKPKITVAGSLDAGIHDLIISGGKAYNYELRYVNGILNIRKAPLTVFADTVDIIYGDALPEIALSYRGFVNGEDSTVIIEKPNVVVYDNLDVGQHELVVFGGKVLNYEFEYINGLLNINKAVLRVVADSRELIYGNTLPELTLSYKGFVNGDDSTAISQRPKLICNVDKNSDVGHYPIIVSGGDAANYKFEYINGELIVNKAPLIALAESYETTYGDPLLESFEFAVSYDGFVNGEDETVLSNIPQATCDADPNSDAGVYPITVSGGDATNYELEYVDGVLIIDKAPLRVSAESFEITYGEPLPEFTLSYDGFVNGEDETVLLSVPQAVCDASSNPDVGEYPIAVSGGDAANYMFHYSDGILKVEKADQIIVWEQSFADTLFVGDVVELTAKADSGLPVLYKSNDESVTVIFVEDGKVLLRCVGAGIAEILAYQNGDKNHKAAESVKNKVVVKDKSGIDDAAASGIGCYPGVADDVLTVSGTAAGMSLRIMDMSGAQRMTVVCTDGETAVDVSGLAQGMYFVLVEDGGDVAASLRFVKK